MTVKSEGNQRKAARRRGARRQRLYRPSRNKPEQAGDEAKHGWPGLAKWVERSSQQGATGSPELSGDGRYRSAVLSERLQTRGRQRRGERAGLGAASVRALPNQDGLTKEESRGPAGGKGDLGPAHLNWPRQRRQRLVQERQLQPQHTSSQRL